MKISLDPMPAQRARAVSRVNMFFNGLAQPHREAAWARKREIAKAGAPYPEWFNGEAELRGISAETLAAIVLEKRDPVEDRELRRQRLLVRIAAAKKPTEIEALLDSLK